MNESETIRPVMRRIGSTEHRFIDFEGATEGFEEEKEVIFEFGRGEVEEGEKGFQSIGDLLERGHLGGFRGERREGVRGEEGVDGAEGGRLVRAIGVGFDGGKGAADADRRGTATGETCIGVARYRCWRWGVESLSWTAARGVPHPFSLSSVFEVSFRDSTSDVR